MAREFSDRRVLEAFGYKINERRYKDIIAILEKSRDYRELLKAGIEMERDDPIIYWVAEHTGNPKLPNITVLPSIGLTHDCVLGSTLGHQHTQTIKGDRRLFQEVYEFHGYGAMLLRRNSDSTLHILKPGEKVVVGIDENMTILNLDTWPLITLDYANPQMNSANKELENRLGPLIMLQYWQASEATSIMIKVNEKYVDEEILKIEEELRKTGMQYWGGVRLKEQRTKFLVGVGDTSPGKDLYEALAEREMSQEEKEEYERMKRSGLGFSASFFLERFLPYRKNIERLGIKIKTGGNIPEHLKKEFSLPLAQLVLDKNKPLLEILGMK
jgi:hypothetical protein